MVAKGGRAQFEDIKHGAIIFLVNGFTMSEEIIKLYVTEAYKVEHHEGPIKETFEWFEGVRMKGRRRTTEAYSEHFADYGVDTLLQKAEQNHMEAYPEARNAVFTSGWHALQYVLRLKRLYPDREPGRYPSESFELKYRKDEEESAKDETFALRA